MKFKKIKLFFCFLLITAYSFSVHSEVSPQTENPLPQEEKSSTEEKEDTSLLITLDVKDADIRDVMRMFSQVSGLNIIISDDVKTKVTLSVTDVNWEDALNMILRTNNLTSVREGKFLRIMTFEKLRREEEGVPLVNETVCLNFIKAADMVGVLDPLRSSRGRVIAHTQTNTIVISEIPGNFKKMLTVIEKLDKRTPQVMIEALMLDVKLTDSEQLGINWSVTHKDVSARSFSVDLDVAKSQGVIRYGKTIFPYANLSALIDMWAQNKRAEILANPKVLTLDGLAANIELTDEIPYLSSTIESTTGTTVTSASFRQAGIKLSVIPNISSGGFVSLSIKTEQSFQSGTITTSTGAQPVIDSRKAETNLLVKDGETIVIGGLRKRDTTKTKDKVPLLGDIPYLGKLFQSNVDQVINTELLIFVTPTIVTEPALKPTEQRSVDKFRRLREEDVELKYLDKAKPFSLRPAK